MKTLDHFGPFCSTLQKDDLTSEMTSGFDDNESLGKYMYMILDISGFLRKDCLSYQDSCTCICYCVNEPMRHRCTPGLKLKG